MRNLAVIFGLSLMIVFMTSIALGQTTTLLSVNRAGGATSNGLSFAPATSADGRFVAFESSATDLVAANDSNNRDDIFVRDLQTNTTTLVSVNSLGTATGNNNSFAPVISAN